MSLEPDSPWTFFIVTITFSWIFWGALFLQSNRESFTPYGVMFYVGGLGPMIGALCLTYHESNRRGVLELLGATLNFSNLSLTGLALILFASTLPNIISVLIGKPPDQPLIVMDLSLGSSFPWLTFLFLVSITEETGWRAYALPRLLEEYAPLVSSLILGSVWAVWHLPLFMIDGTWQNRLGFLTPAFFSYMIQLLPRSVLMTWVFKWTGCNPSSAVLCHFFVNMTGELLDVTQRADLLRFGIEIIMALILLLLG
jgi:membrane protease YdiL (CAAX protease family)